MFGMGFFEILLVAIVAIIALGPEKLPSAMVDIAKFLKKFKSGVEDARVSLDNELNISELKQEASKLKEQIQEVKATVSIPDIDLGLDDILKDDVKNKNKNKNLNVKTKKINTSGKVKKTTRKQDD